MQFKIEKVKNKIKPGNWIGMNYFAAKEKHIPFHNKRNVVKIWKTSKPVMKATIRHEEIEASLMKRGMHYHKAHNLALKYEGGRGRINKILREI